MHRKAKLIPEVLVLVHPSWPWQDHKSIPSMVKARVLKRAAVVLSRVRNDKRPLFMVGPWFFPVSMPEPSKDDLHYTALRILNSENGLSPGQMETAGESLAAKIKKRYPTYNVAVAGFWRDMCCETVLQAIKRIIPNTRHDRRVSQAAPY